MQRLAFSINRDSQASFSARYRSSPCDLQLVVNITQYIKGLKFIDIAGPVAVKTLSVPEFSPHGDPVESVTIVNTGMRPNSEWRQL